MTQKKKNTQRCLHDTISVPAECYLLKTDGRQWLHVCQKRRELALVLAEYANPDGTNIWCSVPTLVKKLRHRAPNGNWSRSTVFDRLDDLKARGLLEDTAWHSYDQTKTRVRSLHVQKLLYSQFTPGETQSRTDAKTGLPSEKDTVQSSLAPVQSSQVPRPVFAGTLSNLGAKTGRNHPYKPPIQTESNRNPALVHGDRKDSKSYAIHFTDHAVVKQVAAAAGNSCTSTEISNEPELTPRQVMERFQENLRKLLDQREHCVTQECRDELDQKIAAAKWAVEQQQARLEKEGSVA